MELFSTPIQKLWESASGNPIAWKHIPNIIHANLYWISSHDMDFLCTDARNFCTELDAAHALVSTLGIVGIECPSYRSKIIPVLGGMVSDYRESVRNLATESLKAMGGKSIYPYLPL